MFIFQDYHKSGRVSRPNQQTAATAVWSSSHRHRDSPLKQSSYANLQLDSEVATASIKAKHISSPTCQ